MKIEFPIREINNFEYCSFPHLHFSPWKSAFNGELSMESRPFCWQHSLTGAETSLCLLKVISPVMHMFCFKAGS